MTFSSWAHAPWQLSKAVVLLADEVCVLCLPWVTKMLKFDLFGVTAELGLPSDSQISWVLVSASTSYISIISCDYMWFRLDLCSSAVTFSKLGDVKTTSCIWFLCRDVRYQMQKQKTETQWPKPLPSSLMVCTNYYNLSKAKVLLQSWIQLSACLLHFPLLLRSSF